MKSLLIFIPGRFHEEKPGFMFGKVVYDDNTGVKKFYVIGIRRTDTVEAVKSGTHIIGYYSGAESRRGYSERKYSDWINIYIHYASYARSNNYDYNLRSIVVNNRKISTLYCHTVIIVYNQLALRETELFVNKAPFGNHFYELLRIVQNKQVDSELRKKGKLTYVKETLLIYNMFLYFYPILLLNKVTNKLMPILKYSSLGLHIIGWLENIKWMLITIIRNKRLTLKTGNYIFASIIDVLLGIFVLQLLFRYLENTSPSQILINNAEASTTALDIFLASPLNSISIMLSLQKVVESLKDLMHWLMGVPAGLKLNHALNNILGKFFLYHIHLWWTFLIFVKPVMDFAFEVLVLFGRLGITFQIAIAADLLAIISFHTYCIYVYAARLFNIQLNGITALVRLFLGKKKNPLRDRVDSCEYQPDQLFVGTLLFTILLFLLPTTWVYYTVFTTLRLLLITFGGFLTRLKFYIQVMPIYTFFKWLFHSYNTSSSVNIKLHSRHGEGPVTLIMTMAVAPWSQTWERSIPDTISRHPPLEWSKLINNIIWGELLYPL